MSDNEHVNNQDEVDSRNTVLVAGGLAFMVLGAGFVMAHPGIRRLVVTSLAPLLPELAKPLKASVNQALPDLGRYLKLRSM